jgi:Carbamate kinase
MSATGNIAQRLVIAIGGNATHPEGIRGTPSEQVEVAARLGDALLPVMELGNELIITHGNGPVVGKILMRQSIARQRSSRCRSTSASRTARAASPIC